MPMMNRIVVDFELDFAAFMLKHTGLLAGTVGTPATTWDHVARPALCSRPAASRWIAHGATR